MYPEQHITLRKELVKTFRIIERDALQRVDYKQRYRLWTYEQLVNLFGDVDQWKCGGRVRNLISGGEARLWLLEEYRLWWRADQRDHLGLLWTCDPRTGIEWARAMIAERTHRDGLFLSRAASMSQVLQPSFRNHFRKIMDCSDKLRNVAGKMKLLGDKELLKLLGVENGCDDDDDPDEGGPVPCRSRS